MKRCAVIVIIFLFMLFTACNDNNAELTDIETPEESPIGTVAAGEKETEPPSGSAKEEPEDEWWMKDVNGGDDENAEATPEATETTSAAAREATKYYSYLTGYQVTRAQQRKRPVAIMINNIKQAQPTVGVAAADIIYECLVEGGQARLMMVLSDYDKTPVYGSVRSSRDYYIDLSQAHDAIYVHAGGTDMAYSELKNRNVDRIDGVNRVDRIGNTTLSFFDAFYRDQERRKTMSLEHTLMTTGTGLMEGIKYAEYRTRHNADYTGTFRFNTEFQELSGNNNTANYVCVPYSSSFQPEFIYNPDDKLYYRKQFGTAHIDGATGEQLRFGNVVVLFAEYTDLRMANGYLACKLTGTGYGFYINGGKYTTIKWQKDTRDGVLSLFNIDDSDLYLNPGKSFICVTSKIYDKSVVINSDLKSVN